MGHGGKKKKRRGRRIPPAIDHTSVAVDLTALRAIYQEDCEFISGDQIKIKLRPYSQDSDVSALLSIRFLDGYPTKSPKLQIELEKGLSKSDADILLSRLYALANSNAREGQVMIYNLVEAAREFLSEVALLEQPHLPRKTVAVSSDRPSKGPFVYGFMDLFIGSDESWRSGLSVDESNSTSTSLDDLQNGSQPLLDRVNQDMKMGVTEDNKPNKVEEEKLDSLEQSSSTDSHTSECEESDENFNIGEEEDTEEESDSHESKIEHSGSASASSVDDHQNLHAEDKDLILARLLQLACSSKGPLADALTDAASELASLGIFSERVADLATTSSSLFNERFNQSFGHRTVASRISKFWKIASDTSTASSSRYLNDFEELKPLGHGGFGRVVLCKNKLDGREYAVKRIQLKDISQPLDERILREVATLSRLQHRHVVRYHQAWFETGYAGCFGEATYSDESSSDVIGQDNNFSTYLYIQMEYCPRNTLSKMFEAYYGVDKKLAWDMFRQIVEGLAHIHGQGIIHRDLNPNNIFFDAQHDIKIGDFGLAKFLKLEQDLDHAETTGLFVTNSPQYGQHFYKAPEIVNQWPKINEKADIFSLGIIFFEFWHPFTCQVERYLVLEALKKGEVPSDWETEFPEQALLLRRMVSLRPSDRPSATELLKNDFPPQMESELLDNILRTMHNLEDTSIYDKVVGAVFSEEIMNTKNQDNESEVKDISLIQHTELDTGIRDMVWEVSSKVFRLHYARRLEINPMCLLRDSLQLNRNAVKLLSNGGDMIQLCHELRLPFINWVVLNQKSSFTRFEIGYVYRRPIGHSPPNRYLQGDFDIIGGASAEAEVIKAAMEIITRFIRPESCDIHLNHGDLLEAIWSWIGIKAGHRQKVAELLALLGSLRPQSTERKSMWLVIRRQLRQELDICEGVVNKFQRLELWLCGSADHALPRLKCALQDSTLAMKALEELSEMVMHLRIRKIDQNVFIDPLIPPTEGYHRDSFFQIHKNNSVGTPMEGSLLAVGGRYDYLLHQMWQSKYKSNPPGGVGTSLALETIIQHSLRNDYSRSVLVCSRGGGG